MHAADEAFVADNLYFGDGTFRHESNDGGEAGGHEIGVLRDLLGLIKLRAQRQRNRETLLQQCLLRG